ncbi:site-2 protease family protein [Halorientalis marina]|jgi:Zn-dependent protease/CBS domain-containing protein|uniref:site-2 protease family protein n=1 Tax=Halorientalis marina TaxID=2931976 RepID=UPI001FF35434|nr:site-2 protease family protein [Halorientalis marina]
MRSFRIGSAFGIPIKLDLTFLLVLPLFAWLISVQIAEYVNILNGVWAAEIAPEALADPTLSIVIGIVAAVGLFAGVVLHELGHSLVAMRFGFPISSITLWLFGGVAQLEEMPEDWKQELLIAVAGPVVSVALGVGSYVAFLLAPSSAPVARFLLGYLALMNVALAIFNMLPGFPMDGGRVLRALLARNRPYARATQIAAEVGKVFAILLGLFGLFGGGGLFLIAIAFFIYIGASGEAQQTVMRAAFEGVTVSDIMTPADDVETVHPEDSVAALLERMFRQRHTGYPVVRDGNVVGLVTLEDALEVKEVERDAYTVSDVMTADLEAVEPDLGAMDALTRMQKEGIGRLLVMDNGGFGEAADGDLVGLVTRSDVMTALSIIKQSGRVRGSDEDPAPNPPASEPEPERF